VPGSLRLAACAAALAVLPAAALARPLLVPDAAGAGALPAPLRGIAAVRRLALDRTALAELRAGRLDVVSDFPLGLDGSRTLRLDQLEPFAPGARLEVVAPTGTRSLPLPDAAYFAGSLDGDPASRVLLVARPDVVHGFAVAAGGVYVFGPAESGTTHVSYALRDVDPAVHRGPGSFCDNPGHPELADTPAAHAQALASPSALPSPQALGSLPEVADDPPPLREADLAIETDGELRAKFASDEAATAYVASLIAAASAIYERDVAVRLRISYLRLWASAASDPWTATATGAALNELRAYWLDSANGMSQVAGPRDTVHFVSGKAVQGGVAYVDVLCNQSYGFAVSQVRGSFDLAAPSSVWDVVVFSHELGHNFGSRHTHCYSPPLDRCYNAEGGCYDGDVTVSRGTLMSYCHLHGGTANLDLAFGDVVNSRIGTSVSAAACLAAVAGGPTTTTTSTTTPATTTTAAVATTTTTSNPVSSSSTTVWSGTTSTAVATSSTSAVTTSTETTTSSTIPATDHDDGDGIPGALDACPGTPPGELVAADGCSVCPCGGDPTLGVWPSRASYLRCVRAEVVRRRTAGLDAAAGRAALRHARRSTCGRPLLTRCCIPAAGGRCRLVPASHCDWLARPGRAADAGPGSCVPDPCPR